MLRAIWRVFFLDKPELCPGVTATLIARVDPRLRAMLASVTAFCLEPKVLVELAEEMEESLTGGPPLFRPHDDHDLWADGASRNERVACMTMCFDLLCRLDQGRAVAYFPERVAT